MQNFKSIQMKLYINLFFVILFTPISLFAYIDNDSIVVSHLYDLELDCDACGCSATSTSNGIGKSYKFKLGFVTFINLIKAKEDAFSNKRIQKQQFNKLSNYGQEFQ